MVAHHYHHYHHHQQEPTISFYTWLYKISHHTNCFSSLLLPILLPSCLPSFYSWCYAYIDTDHLLLKLLFTDTYLSPETITKTQHQLPKPNDAIILIFYRQITSYHNTAPCHTNTILYHTTTTPLTPIVTKTTTSTVPTYLKLLLLSGTYLTLPYLFQKYLILLFPTYHTITSHSTRRHLPYWIYSSTDGDDDDDYDDALPPWKLTDWTTWLDSSTRSFFLSSFLSFFLLTYLPYLNL